MMKVNERIKCYRFELGQLLENVSNNYFKIIEKMLEASIKMHDDVKKKFENQINENLNIITKLEKEKREMDVLNRDLKNK